MSARTRHLLQQSVRRLAIDIVRDTGKRALADADTTLAEREEQVQFDMRGTATSTAVWITVDLPFQHAFSTAVGRRNSQLDRPHTSFGYELLSVSDRATNEPQLGGVVIHPAVVAWDIPDGLNIVGATVAVCAIALTELPVSLDFRASVHLTFQGYGIPQDPQPDMEI